MEATEPKKRGRSKMTDEEKAVFKAKLAAKKAEKAAAGATLLDEVKELNKKIKKGVVLLSSKEIEKLKELLTANYSEVDATLKEVAEKEKVEALKELDKEEEKLKKALEKIQAKKAEL